MGCCLMAGPGVAESHVGDERATQGRKTPRLGPSRPRTFSSTGSHRGAAGARGGVACRSEGANQGRGVASPVGGACESGPMGRGGGA